MTHHRRRIFLAVLVALGLLTLIPGITLPMMTVKKLVLVKNTFTVLSGIGALLADKTFGLGLLLLGFSVIFPLGKYAVMAAYLYYYPPMLDVFVVAQMLMILKLGWLVEIQIHSGIYWYSATALLSLIAGIWIEHDIKQRMQKAG